MDRDRDQIFETYRASFRLLMSGASFLLTADVTIIGFAISNKSSSLVALGAIFPIYMMISYSLFSRLFCPIFICGIKDEHFNPSQNSNFFSLALISANEKIYHCLIDIIKTDNSQLQENKIQEIKGKFIPPFVRSIISSIAVVHVILAVSLWYFSNWSFI